MAKETYAQAEEALGWSVEALSFEGPEEKLNRTEYTQPALLTASIAIWRALPGAVQALGDVVAGHSLGEYSALVAAESLSFEEAVRLVHQRGRFMQEAVPPGRGKMAAVVGLARSVVTEICREASSDGVVAPANYNGPEQVVIAGESPAVDRAMVLAKGAGAKRVLPLSVSVPSHSPLMATASERLARELETIRFHDLSFPLVNNLEARTITTGEQAKKGLAGQLSSPLLWEESIQSMWERGVRSFVEVGPGRVLSGLVKRIRREAEVFHVEDPSSLEKTCAGLLG